MSIRRIAARVATLVAWLTLAAWGASDTTTNMNPSLMSVAWFSLAAVVIIGALIVVWGEQQ